MAIDATPLLGTRTGVGRFCEGALGALASAGELDVDAFAVTWRRRRRLPPLVPAEVRVRQRAMPARPLHLAWAHLRRYRPWSGSWGLPTWSTGPTSSSLRPGAPPGSSPCTTSPRCAIPSSVTAPPSGSPAWSAAPSPDGAWVHTPSRFVADEVVAEFDVDPGARARRVPRCAPGVRGVFGPSARPVVAAGDVALRPGRGHHRAPQGLPWARKRFQRRRRCPSRRRPRDRRRRRVGRARFPRGARGVSDVVTASCSSAMSTTTSLASWLGGAEVLAFPSVYEGFGFPPLEAMAAGVPVVASGGRGGARSRRRRGRCWWRRETSRPCRRARHGAGRRRGPRRARRQGTVPGDAHSRGKSVAPAWPSFTPTRPGPRRRTRSHGRGRRRGWRRAEVLLVAEQLRRQVPGGIGTYVRGLLGGLRTLDQCPRRAAIRDAVRESRSPSRLGRGVPDPLEAFGRPAHRVAPARSGAHPDVGPRPRACTGGLRPRALGVGGGATGAGDGGVAPRAPLCRGRRHPRRGVAAPSRGLPAAGAGAGTRPRSGRALRHATHFVVPSDVVAADLVKAGASAGAVSVIPLGSDILRDRDDAGATALLERLGVRDEFLLSVGTLEPRKNLPRLFEAYGVARRTPPRSVAVGGRRTARVGPGARVRGGHRVHWQGR